MFVQAKRMHRRLKQRIYLKWLYTDGRYDRCTIYTGALSQIVKPVMVVAQICE